MYIFLTRGNDSLQNKLTFEIRVIFEPLMIAIFQSCLLPKMKLSVVLEGRFACYQFMREKLGA